MSEKAAFEESAKAHVELPIAPTSSTARASIDTALDESETQRENARSTNPNSFTRTESGINVNAAEAEFATLQRELSGISQTSRRLSKTVSKQSRHKVAAERDVEKSASTDSTDEEPFDLESTLHGNRSVRNH